MLVSIDDGTRTAGHLSARLNRFLVNEPCRMETGDGGVVVTSSGTIYKLESVLGVGGLNVVYVASRYHDRLVVALKLPSANAKSHSLATSLLEREAALLSRLDHENIVRLVDVGRTAQGEPFIAMDLVRAQTVDLLMIANGGRLPFGRAVNICVQVCDALIHAHERGVIHRDIKPGNIMVRTGGGQDRIMLFDFGIASLDGDESDVADTGSLLYASPEQLANDVCTASADVYQMGLLLFELITGYLPFDRDVIAAVRYRQGELPLLPDTAEELLPGPIRELLLAALEPDLAQRLPSMALFAYRLRQALVKSRVASLRFAVELDEALA